MPDSGCGMEVRTHPSRSREQADGQIGAGPAVMQGVEVALGESRRDGVKSRDVCLPLGNRVGRVQPYRLLDRLPESFDIRFAEYLLRPGRVGHRDDGPVDLEPANQ